MKKSIIPIISCISWSGLGFLRGIQSYKYSLNKYNKQEPYLYIHSFMNGCAGIIIYACPVFLPITCYKEIYRLEVNIRNLEDKKNCNYYQDLL